MAKAKVFMIMPFEDPFFEVFEMLKRQFGETFVFSNAAIEGNQQNILKDIIQPIYESDIIIADLTKLNPNVMYELGLAHTFNKKTIIITQDDLGTLPFDLKQYRAKDYSTHFKKFAELLEYLKSALEGGISNTVIFSNPVKDFLTMQHINGLDWVTQEKVNIDIDNTEKGFFDFIEEIENDISEMVSNIGGMTQDLNTMTSSISNSTDEINRVNKTGGNSKTTFVRKEAKKVAASIETFSSQLKGYNKNIATLWDKTERNTLGLLENKHALDKADQFIEFLKTLKALQNSIFKSNESVVSMKAASLQNLGLERSLNQSIRFLDEDLKVYLEVMERIIASIDKIIYKSRLIIGDIDFSEASE